MLCASGKEFDLSIRKIVVNENFTIFTLPRVKYTRYFSGQLILRLPIYLLGVLTFDYDLLYAFTVAQPQIGIAAMVGKVLRRKKLVVDWDDLWGGGFANSHSFLIRKILEKSEVFFLRFADRITCASQMLYKKASSVYANKGNVYYLPNGCKTKHFSRTEYHQARQKLGYELNEVILLSMGNTYNSITLDLLFDTYRALLNTRSEIKLIMLSSIELPPTKKDQYSDILSRILFTGYVSDEQKDLYLSAANILVLPMENNPIEEARFPIRLGDYLLSGRPIVSNAVGEVKYYLEKYQAGLTCQPDSPEDFARAILTMLDDRTLAENCAANALKLSLGDLSDLEVVGKVEQILSLE